MTADELFRCRLCVLLGVPPSEIDDLPATDYDMLLRYWTHEPWGAWRDNLHAAILAREIRRPQVKRGTAVPLDQFFYVKPAVQQRNRVAGFIGFLKGLAGSPKRE